MNRSSGPEQILFDFKVSPDSHAWQIINDDVMGGVSTSQFRIRAQEGAVFSGSLSLANNGGFASVRSLPVRLDLTGCDSFLLRVRGDGRRYKFTVRTSTRFDAPLYQCAFGTRPDEWEEHRLVFTDFVPTLRGRLLADAPQFDPAQVCSVGFLISDRQEGAFQLEISWIMASRPIP